MSSCRPDQDGEDREREQQAEQQRAGEDEAGDIDDVRGGARTGRAGDDRTGWRSSGASVLLPGPADEARRRGGSGARVIRNSSEAHEEEAQERGAVAGDLVAAGGEQAIAAVIVWPGPSGLTVNSEPPVAPAAMATTIVSPTARETAEDHRRDDAGDRRRDDDPQARRELAGAQPVGRLAEAIGTARIASSEIEATSGMVRMPTPMPAASRLKPSLGEDVWTTFGLIQRQGEEAEDDAGDAGEDLEDRLDDAADLGLAYSDR